MTAAEIRDFKFDVTTNAMAIFYGVTQKAMDNAISQITLKATNIMPIARCSKKGTFSITIEFMAFGQRKMSDLFFTCKTGKLIKTVKVQ